MQTLGGCRMASRHAAQVWECDDPCLAVDDKILMVVARQDGIFQLCLCLNCLVITGPYTGSQNARGRHAHYTLALIKLLVKQGRVIVEVGDVHRDDHIAAQRGMPPSTALTEIWCCRNCLHSPESWPARWGQCRCLCGNDRGSCCDSPPCGRKIPLFGSGSPSVALTWTTDVPITDASDRWRHTTAGQTRRASRWCPHDDVHKDLGVSAGQGVRVARCSAYMPGGTGPGAPRHW